MCTEPYIIADANECVQNTDGCAHNCSNTIGSYTCSCETGYSLDDDDHGCTGNTTIKGIGSIMDLHVCLSSDINECSSGIHNCDENAACSNTNGRYSCHCNTGWGGSGFNCTSKRSLHMHCYCNVYYMCVMILTLL